MVEIFEFEMYCAIEVKKWSVLVAFVTLLAVKHFYMLFSICCFIFVCCYAPCVSGLFDLHASDQWLGFCVLVIILRFWLLSSCENVNR